MNARIGRQADEFVEIAEGLKGHGSEIDALIIQMGNNGPLYSDEMDALQKATANVGELFLVTDHAPVSWIDESDHALNEAAEDWPHTTLVDWGDVAAEHENLLYDDIHLKPSGVGVYARLISGAVHAKFDWPQVKSLPAQPRAGSASTNPASETRAEGGSQPSSG